MAILPVILLYLKVMCYLTSTDFLNIVQEICGGQIAGHMLKWKTNKQKKNSMMLV